MGKKLQFEKQRQMGSRHKYKGSIMESDLLKWYQMRKVIYRRNNGRYQHIGSLIPEAHLKERARYEERLLLKKIAG